MAAFMPVAFDDTFKCSRVVVGRMRIVILTTMTTITITMTRNDVVAGCLAARCLICCLYVHIYIFFKKNIFFQFVVIFIVVVVAIVVTIHAVIVNILQKNSHFSVA